MPYCHSPWQKKIRLIRSQKDSSFVNERDVLDESLVGVVTLPDKIIEGTKEAQMDVENVINRTPKTFSIFIGEYVTSINCFNTCTNEISTFRSK